MLKIALICDWYLPRVGGIEIQMHGLARSLIACGHDVRVITSCPGPDLIDGVRVYRLKVPLIPGVKLSYGPVTERRLRELLEREHVDVIHGHYLLSSLTHLGIYLGRQLDIPTVFTHHSLNAEFHNRPLLIAVPLMLSFFGLVLFHRFLRHASFYPSVVTAVSNAVAADMSIVFRNKKIPVLPNGINTEKWRCEKVRHGRFNIMSVMRLARSKDPMTLIRAIPEINSRLPEDLRPVYTIIGDGPERKRIQREITRLHIADQVLLAGLRTHKEIKRQFAITDLFLLPSRQEGFGIAALEALSAGIPVVGMNRGGLMDIVEQGRNGFLADSFEEFVEYSVELIVDRDKRRRMSRTAGEMAEMFSWEEVVFRHVETYEQAIRNHRLNSISG